MYKIVNVITDSVVAEEKTIKDISKFISKEGVTNNSVKTIEKKVSDAIKSGEILYETFKINKNEEEIKMKDVQNKEIVVEENKNEEEIEMKEEKIEANVDEQEEIEKEVEQENKDTKELLDEDNDKKKDEKKDEEKKPNKRRQGKIMIAYENGEEIGRFPSIKATATHFKELLGLGHMPFTPIMKSARQGIDWNQYSFEFENPEDLHIPKSMKTEKEDKNKDNNELKDKTKNEDTNDEEVIEEIVEVVDEEI